MVDGKQVDYKRVDNEFAYDFQFYDTEADIGEERYRETVTEFKSKWFKRRKCDIEALVNEEFEKKKAELLKELKYMGERK